MQSASAINHAQNVWRKIPTKSVPRKLLITKFRWIRKAGDLYAAQITIVGRISVWNGLNTETSTQLNLLILKYCSISLSYLFSKLWDASLEKCDENLASELSEMLDSLTPNQIDRFTTTHGFDFDGSCKRDRPRRNTECCGEFPVRYTYEIFGYEYK